MTSTSKDAVLDGSQRETDKPGVSDFLTVQSFTNFAAMSGAITAAWLALQQLPLTFLASNWVPFGFAFAWAFVSYQISKPGLANGPVPWPTTMQAGFIGLINALVLASSVIGTGTMIASTDKSSVGVAQEQTSTQP